MHTGLFEIIHNDPCAIGRSLDQRPIHLLGLGGQGHAQHQAGKVHVHQHGTVAVPPVQGDESAFAGLQLFRLFREIHVQVLALFPGRLSILLGHAVVHKPVEVVAHAALAGLVAQQPLNHAIFHHAAHAGHGVLLVGDDDVTGRGAHNHQHAAGLGGTGGGQGHMSVHVGHRHGGTRQKARDLRALGGDFSSLCADGIDMGGKLVLHQIFQPGIQRPEEIPGGIALGLAPHGLVTRHAGVAGFHAGKLHDHPVSRLHEAVHRVVQRRVFVQHLPDFGHHPFRGSLSPVSGQEFLPPLLRNAVQAVGLVLGGVVLPELDPGVGIVGVFLLQAQGRARRVHRHHGAGSKIDAHADNVFRGNPGLLHGLRDDIIQTVQIILGMLQGPVGLQPLAGGQIFVHYAVRIVHGGVGQLPAGAHFRHQGSGGQRAEIDADGIFRHLEFLPHLM